MAKYAVHPGWIPSKNDGDRHFINYRQLIHLYRVRPKECIRIDDDDPMSGRGYDLSKLTHLYPSYDGDYSIPKYLINYLNQSTWHLGIEREPACGYHQPAPFLPLVELYVRSVAFKLPICEACVEALGLAEL